MGSVIRLFNLPNELSALENEARAHRDLAEIATTQAGTELTEAGVRAEQIVAQAQREAAAISQATKAGADSERYNARQAAINADAATAAANLEESRKRKENKRLLDQQFGAITTTGFQTEDFQDIIRESAEEAEQDALLIRRNGILQNLDFAAQSDLARGRALDIETAGAIEQASVLETGRQTARATIISGRTRSRASTAEAIRGQAAAKAAKSRKTTVVIDSFGDVADDAAKAIGMG